MKTNLRISFLLGCFFLIGALVIFRLFYWQVLSSGQLAAMAESQHWISFEVPAERGRILAVDGFPLVTNEEAYLVFASLPDLKEDPGEVAAKLSPFLATSSAQLETELMIKQRLDRQDLAWVPLKHKLSRETKEILEKLEVEGLGFEEEQRRSYPEGSVAAHLLGFVGSDLNGREKGYFGLEGYYDLELRGHTGLLKREKDASGEPILVGEKQEEKKKDGRDLVTTIDRSVQFVLEDKLEKGLKRYGAKSGNVLVMDPETGAIVAVASRPKYDPKFFSQYDRDLFPNPAVNFSYEPGSTFKVLIVAAALNEGAVKPETRCDQCDGPRNISGYTIETWNGEYPPEPTMVEVIEQSNNVGMVFVGESLGKERLVDYLQRFGFGEETGVDLEDESTPPLRPLRQWGKIDVATASFGQGIAVTPIQMLRAVAAIANQGELMRPFLVQKVIDSDGTMEIKPHSDGQVISPTTARVITEMMINAVDNGEAQWCKPEGFRVAGKTGTAQIPVAGHYDEEKTIASFVGFAPADNPRFVMLVTLREPTSSPWGSETAAPLWFDIASELFTYYGILPG
jgi:cell division protein FtsI/penicillin-binding protein 2